ncbi:MAG: segregation/condensation protein A [Clostridia bacterium]
MEEALKFHLEYFDGPLDLLLHLIKDSKIDVETVFLSDVTEQFLEYMSQIDNLDMELASEFLSVACTLLEIKSKALLPKYQEVAEDLDDDANDLLRRLEEYKLFKDVSKELKEIEDVDKLYRAQDISAFVDKVVFKESDLDKLMSAFTKLMMMSGDDEKREKMVERVIPKDTFTIEMQSFKLLEKLRTDKKVTFFSLFDEKVTKLELVVTLMAILEMMKDQKIKIKQKSEFEDIEIELIIKEVA